MKTYALDSFKSSYAESFDFHDENQLMLDCYVEQVLNRCQGSDPVSVLSFGIGFQTVPKRIISALADRMETYVILEGSADILHQFRESAVVPPAVNLVHTMFEDFQTDHQFDIMEMGFVLEHVEDPQAVLKKYREYLKPNGCMLIAVPNAESLHRRVGLESGFLDDLHALSEHDHRLGHKRYFDLQSLVDAVQSSGLSVRAKKGIFLKPLTTRQLGSLELDRRVLNAFCQIGLEYPELCNAILVEAIVDSTTS